MQTKYIVGIAALAALATTLLFLPFTVKGQPPTVVTHETVLIVKQPAMTAKQVIWLAKLMQCESGLKIGAINPNDLDNTPSYGLLQFKPSTYAAAAKKYGLASTTDYMNPEGQVAIVTRWILEGGADWSHQFPACVQKLGVPPQTGVSLP